ncbi:hypothetical protein GIB67_024096 [Kingdonia uniflora]|uniref:Pentatricopeptide repeat-containing protein n=1 Tax=Kingdonia uniflora TaxID=39325 RepID=A0A7J7MMK9_9MAGN|nr:hypothetical protein GIB67_024096 [Kingdonia uniflora]
MVDILERAGKLDEVIKFIHEMECEPDVVMWIALLGACRVHKNVDLAIYVAKQILNLEPEDEGNYIVISNAYATTQRWEDVEEVRKTMKGKGVKKEPGCSWIELKKQDRSLRVTHNLAVFGGCGLVLSIITGLFGINVDGIPGAQNTPYAFVLFSGVLFVIGLVLIGIGLVYLGLKQPITDEQVQVRKFELQQLVKMFQHEAETHVKVRQEISRNSLPPTAADMLTGNDIDYFLIR